MNKEDKKLQKHLVDEMMKVSKTNPDVIIYMGALIKKYEELEQENINIKQQLLENKISLKDVEYQEKIKYKNIIDELEETLEYEKNDYNGNIDIETHNIDSEFLRGNAWEADYILDKLKELKEKKND